MPRLFSQSSSVAIILSLTLSILPACLITFIVPKFKAVFAGMGTELSGATLFLLNNYLMVWFLPLLVILTYLFAKPGAREPRMLAIAWIGLLLIVPTCLFLLYVPIFSMGTAI
jgi:type II secretory pathway component PulF